MLGWMIFIPRKDEKERKKRGRGGGEEKKRQKETMTEIDIGQNTFVIVRIVDGFSFLFKTAATDFRKLEFPSG